MKLPVAAAAALLVASGACGSDLPSASFIDKLRVLAVQAEPPEVAPGTATTVQALVVEPIITKPDVQPPDALWLACKPPPGALQDLPCAINQTTLPPDCSVDASGAVCILGSGTTVHYTPDASAVGDDKKGVVLLTVVVADNGGAANCLTDIQQHGGTPQHPDRCVIAFKRLPVNANGGAILNRNPPLSALTLIRGAETPQPLAQGVTARFPMDGSTLKLQVTRGDDAAEKDAQGNYEALAVSWFTTSGKIDGARSQFDVPGCAAASDCPMSPPASDSSTSWIVPGMEQLASTADATQTVNFWAVVRDDHGGVSWLTGTASPSPSPL